MIDENLHPLRFPIGEYVQRPPLTPEQYAEAVAVLRAFPEQMKAAVAGLSDAELALRYRPEGWTIRQVVHHCADSHMNSYIRAKLALTEDTPTIKPYDEAAWATQPDYSLPVSVALTLLEGLHARWAHLYASLDEEQKQRAFVHPEHGRKMIISEVLDFYSWHCRHHLAHVRLALEMRY